MQYNGMSLYASTTHYWNKPNLFHVKTINTSSELFGRNNDKPYLSLGSLPPLHRRPPLQQISKSCSFQFSPSTLPTHQHVSPTFPQCFHSPPRICCLQLLSQVCWKQRCPCTKGPAELDYHSTPDTHPSPRQVHIQIYMLQGKVPGMLHYLRLLFRVLLLAR